MDKFPTEMSAEEKRQPVKRFLLVAGFSETSGEALEILSEMIANRAEQNAMATEKKVDTSACKWLRDATLRARLAYYIPKNYARVRAYVYETYGYEMYPGFTGVKNFAEQMAIVYSVFVKSDKK